MKKNILRLLKRRTKAAKQKHLNKKLWRKKRSHGFTQRLHPREEDEDNVSKFNIKGQDDEDRIQRRKRLWEELNKKRKVKKMLIRLSRTKDTRAKKAESQAVNGHPPTKILIKESLSRQHTLLGKRMNQIIESYVTTFSDKLNTSTTLPIKLTISEQHLAKKNF